MNKNDINYLTKYKADAKSIKRAKLTYVSNMDKFDFFKSLPPETKQFFYNCGYIPTNYSDASNFVSSIAQLNDKTEYDIDYALKDILPKEKFYKLNKSSYIYALYPKVWDKLATEDRLVCLNFAFKNLLDKNNLNKSYQLLWFVENYKNNIYGAYSSVGNELFINFNKVLIANSFRLYSTMVHEINHAKQERQREHLKNQRDALNLNTYEKLENVKDDFFYNFLNHPKSILPFVDSSHKEKIEKYLNTEQWEDFADTFYCCDYMEISSRNVQVKAIEQTAKQCYSFYNDDIKNDKELLTYCKDIINLHNNENYSSDYIEELNKFQTLVNYNMARCKHLHSILFKINIDIPSKVYDKIYDEYHKDYKFQRKLCETLIDTFENKSNIPESFDRSLFDNIDKLFVKNKETAQDTINYYKDEVKKEQEEKQRLEKEQEKNQTNYKQDVNEL